MAHHKSETNANKKIVSNCPRATKTNNNNNINVFNHPTNKLARNLTWLVVLWARRWNTDARHGVNIYIIIEMLTAWNNMPCCCFVFCALFSVKHSLTKKTNKTAIAFINSIPLRKSLTFSTLYFAFLNAWKEIAMPLFDRPNNLIKSLEVAALHMIENGDAIDRL